jgi:hypothetical protein
MSQISWPPRAQNLGYANMSPGDEVKKVRTRVPHSIIIACVGNVIMLFAFVICLLYTIGNVDAVTNTPTGLPLLEVYYQATNSKPASIILTLLPVIIIFFSLFNAFASVSRLVWQFSRDNGLPFSSVFAYVRHMCLAQAIRMQRLILAGPPHPETPSKCAGIGGRHHFSSSHHLHTLGNGL